jgi:hypothetical protein
MIALRILGFLIQHPSFISDRSLDRRPFSSEVKFSERAKRKKGGLAVKPQRNSRTKQPIHTLLTLPYAVAEMTLNTALSSTLIHTQQIPRTTVLPLIACAQHRALRVGHLARRRRETRIAITC